MKRILFLLCAFIWMALNSAAQPQAIIDSLLRRLPEAKEDTAKAFLLARISFLYYTTDADKGLQYGKMGLALSQKLHWTKGMAICYNSIGSNFIYKSMMDSAVVYFERSIALNEQIGEKLEMAKANENIGVIYFYRSNYPRALEYYFKGLKIKEELGDKMAIALSLSNIGICYNEEDNYEKAQEYYERSLRLSREMDNNSGIAITLGNLGINYYQQKNYAQALHCDSLALSMFRKMDDKAGVVRNQINISNCYRDLKRYEEAMITAREALNIQQKLSNKNAEASIYGLMGLLYLDAGKDSSGAIHASYAQNSSRAALLQESIAYTKKGIVLSEAFGNQSLLSDLYAYLADAYTATGNYREALAAHRLYTELKDSVSSLERKVKISNLETVREMELKDKQIELDRLAVAKKRNERVFYIMGIGFLLVVTGSMFRNNKAQKHLNSLLAGEKQKVEIQSETLQETNEELSSTLEYLRDTQEQLIIAEKQKENEMIRSRISQDIHDDISSELNKIFWVSSLATSKAGHEDLSEVSGLLKKITASSRETVTKLGEIIWTVNPKNDHFDSLLAYMRNHVGKFLEDTSLQYQVHFPEDGSNIAVNPELKRNLFLVLKEALNNAVKYAGAHTITVSCQLDGPAYVFEVSDDGKGMDPAIIQGGGNGLDNMKQRMQSINGDCSFITAPGKGTSVRFSGILY